MPGPLEQAGIPYAGFVTAGDPSRYCTPEFGENLESDQLSFRGFWTRNRHVVQYSIPLARYRALQFQAYLITMELHY